MLNSVFLGVSCQYFCIKRSFISFHRHPLPQPPPPKKNEGSPVLFKTILFFPK